MATHLRAEIISVGTELLLGHTINRDAAIVATLLAELGLDLHNVQTVGDNPERLAAALGLAATRSDIIITTGGLGPTDDDLTKSTVAAFAGVELVEDASTVQRIKEYFGARTMSRNQMRQACVPANSVVFPNDVGTAPGCAVPVSTQAGGGHVIMLPGPPRELEHMLASYVRPFLEKLSGAIIFSTKVHTFGIGEGAGAELINDLMTGANPSVATYAHGGEMFVKVTAKAQTAGEARALCGPLVSRVCQRLGDVVYGVDMPSLECVAVSRLIENGRSIAVAESCTGGLLAKRITDMPGASAVFSLGVVTYSNDAKERVLHVPADMLRRHGAVSPQVARAMAEGVRQLAGSDLAVGITGIAGPDGGTAEKPVGLVYIAFAADNLCHVREMRPTGRYMGRGFVRDRAVSHALDLVRRHLQGLSLDLVWR